VGQVEEDKTKT
jgi:hypothetical protein